MSGGSVKKQKRMLTKILKKDAKTYWNSLISQSWKDRLWLAWQLICGREL
jgi:hypothetical protein